MTKHEKKNKPKRQVVMVIVEGQSDENALSVALTEAFEQKYGDDTIVLFAKLANDDGTKGGDITSRIGVVPEKLHMLMNKLIVMPCLHENSLMPKYVTEIVQIIDTDGAYIPDAQIKPNEGCMADSTPIYSDYCILSNDPMKIKERNIRKRNNIKALLDFQLQGFEIQNFVKTEVGNKPTTKGFCVPYTLYYFSCNLDHFICGNANLDRYKKIFYADVFARKDGLDAFSFANYLHKDEGTVKDMTHEESWSILQTNCNSLKRLTNIGILIDLLLGMPDDSHDILMP